MTPFKPRSSEEDRELTLEDWRTFLSLPISERNQILQQQAEILIEHYQQDVEWREWMSDDFIDY